jgi:uncharacterized protein (DUF58 family)
MKARVTVRLSRTGWALAFTCLAIAAAAANTGNNLLYLLLALLIAAYPVSGLFVRRSLRALDADLLAPAEIHAGDPFDVAVPLVGRGRFGATGVIIELRGADKLRSVSSFLPVACPVLHLPAGDRRTLSLAARCPRRGDVRLILVARSPFPFGLLDATRILQDAALVVLPSPDPSWREAAAPASEEGAPRPERGQGADILDIRDHRPGDDARRIDWKATARLDRAMVRDHARDEERRAILVVDAVRVPAGIDRDAPAERAISRAAGAVTGLTSMGWRVRLVLPDGIREGDARALLRELARLPVRVPTAEAASALSGDWWQRHVDGRDAVLMFHSGSPT